MGENIDRGLDALGNENAREAAMTIAKRLRQEGRLEGIGRTELIWKQLKKRFGNLSPALERRLNESGVEVLDRFGESIFDFESLEDAEKWWEDVENGGRMPDRLLSCFRQVFPAKNPAIFSACEGRGVLRPGATSCTRRVKLEHT